MKRLLRAGLRHSPRPLQVLVRQRTLLYQLTRRDVEIRYRGSSLGLLWSMINPLFLLAVYTFVFGTIYKGNKWPGRTHTGVLDFALIIFCGLITMLLFTEPVTRSATAIVGVPNYVKKVVFPLELIPASMVFSAVFHFVMSFIILIVCALVFEGVPPVTILALPLALLPVVLFGLGFAWFLASLGVFVRDLVYIVQIAVQILLFLTPVFYPDSLVPKGARPFLLSMNPLAHAVNNVRKMVLFGGPINWGVLVAWIAVSALFAIAGFRWFTRTKTAFADVI